MRSRDPVRIGPERATAGPASIVQGVYGARGNLELVVPDAVDGLWVFWFNADRSGDPEQTPEVPPGAWSGGLAFAGGTRYREALVLQSTLGPDHLEVLALTVDGKVESWWWSPGPGFQRREVVVAREAARIAAEHDAGELRVSIVDAAGARRVLVSTPVGYPDRRWSEAAPDAAAAPGPARPDHAEEDADAEAERALRGAGVTEIDAGTARSALSDRDGRTRELTWRSRGALFHLALPID